MKRFFAVIVASLILFSSIPASMVGTAQAATPVMVNGSGGVFYASSGSVGGGIVASGPSSLTSGSPATISQQQALAITEGIFPDIGSVDVNAQLEPLPVSTWSLSWSNQTAASVPVTNMSNDVQINAVTGALDSFHISDWQADQTGSPLITRDEALQKAEAFIKQYHPEELAAASLSDTPAIDYGYKKIAFAYNFNWNRMEQGVPVAWDGIQAGVDPFSGRIVNCSFNWHTGVAFPSPVAVDSDKENQLLDQFGVIPCYQVQAGQVNAQGVPEVSLVYVFNCSPDLRIDPTTGGALTSDDQPASLQDFVLLPGLAPAVSDAVYAGIPAMLPTQPVSPDVGKQNAERFFQALGLSGQVTSNGGGGSGYDGVFYDKSQSYTLQSDTGSGIQLGPQPTVGIDAVTGEVASYFRGSGASTSGTGAATPALTPEQARDKALAFIKQVSPDQAGQIVASNQPGFYPGNGQSVSVSFTRLINGIPFPHDGISMTLDQSGTVMAYNCNWHQVALAPLSKIITADQARQILLQNTPLKAEYGFPVSLEQGYLTAQASSAPANPVFALDYQSGGVAADTGQPVKTGFGIPLAAQQLPVTVPPDHWASVPLAFLADSQLLPAESFDPDGVVTRRDVLRVLMGSFGSMVGETPGQPGAGRSAFGDVALNDPDYDLIQSAVGRGVLDPGPSLNPDGTITRQDFVEWLVRALGYRQVAEMPASITLKFADVQQLSNTDRNYLAIAEGLGIVKGDARGMFHPDAPLTWASLATMDAEAAPRLQTL